MTASSPRARTDDLSQGLVRETLEIGQKYASRADVTKIIARSVWTAGMETSPDSWWRHQRSQASTEPAACGRTRGLAPGATARPQI